MRSVNLEATCPFKPQVDAALHAAHVQDDDARAAEHIFVVSTHHAIKVSVHLDLTPAKAVLASRLNPWRLPAFNSLRPDNHNGAVR